MSKIKLAIKFNYHDLWVGVYWCVKHLHYVPIRILEIYVCIIPLFPIIISIKLHTHESFWPKQKEIIPIEDFGEELVKVPKPRLPRNFIPGSTKPKRDQ